MHCTMSIKASLLAEHVRVPATLIQFWENDGHFIFRYCWLFLIVHQIRTGCRMNRMTFRNAAQLQSCTPNGGLKDQFKRLKILNKTLQSTCNTESSVQTLLRPEGGVLWGDQSAGRTFSTCHSSMQTWDYDRGCEALKNVCLSMSILSINARKRWQRQNIKHDLNRFIVAEAYLRG